MAATCRSVCSALALRRPLAVYKRTATRPKLRRSDRLFRVTGWDVTVEELERAGERIVNLERLFNVREGVRRAQDTLPWKVMHEPIPEGPSAGACSPPTSSERCSTSTTRCVAGTARACRRPPAWPRSIFGRVGLVLLTGG